MLESSSWAIRWRLERLARDEAAGEVRRTRAAPIQPRHDVAGHVDGVALGIVLEPGKLAEVDRPLPFVGQRDHLYVARRLHAMPAHCEKRTGINHC